MLPQWIMNSNSNSWVLSTTHKQNQVYPHFCLCSITLRPLACRCHLSILASLVIGIPHSSINNFHKMSTSNSRPPEFQVVVHHLGLQAHSYPWVLISFAFLGCESLSSADSPIHHSDSVTHFPIRHQGWVTDFEFTQCVDRYQ